jgi:hypothetical protein
MLERPVAVRRQLKLPDKYLYLNDLPAWSMRQDFPSRSFQ